MPLYDFTCPDCAARRETMASFETSRTLELVCVSCGGTMTVAPVLKANISAFRAEAVEGAGGHQAASAANACGHAYACRCASIRLSRPNPFKEQIQAAAGKPES